MLQIAQFIFNLFAKAIQVLVHEFVRVMRRLVLLFRVIRQRGVRK